MSYVGPLTQSLLDAGIKELKKKETKEKIMTNFVDPLVSEFFKRYSVYIYSFFLIQILIVILLLIIIFTLKKR